MSSRITRFKASRRQSVAAVKINPVSLPLYLSLSVSLLSTAFLLESTTLKNCVSF